MDFFFGKTAVFPADMAGLGKYSMGGYGRIGVYRVREGAQKGIIELSVGTTCI